MTAQHKTVLNLHVRNHDSPGPAIIACFVHCARCRLLEANAPWLNLHALARERRADTLSTTRVALHPHHVPQAYTNLAGTCAALGALTRIQGVHPCMHLRRRARRPKDCVLPASWRPNEAGGARANVCLRSPCCTLHLCMISARPARPLNLLSPMALTNGPADAIVVQAAAPAAGRRHPASCTATLPCRPGAALFASRLPSCHPRRASRRLRVDAASTWLPERKLLARVTSV
jgi:hypothetical protein